MNSHLPVDNSVSVLSCININKTYSNGPQELHILKNISLTINQGEKIAIIGASGSGKSTLLHCLGGLDKVSSGSLEFAGVDYFSLSSKKQAALRNKHLGFVYQFHHLLPEFTALENVAMPLMIGGHTVAHSNERAREMLDKVGLGGRIQHKPAELSGGERQRAAIARAMVTQPACLLADEPTGNLDSHNAEQIHELLLQLNQDSGTALVMVTHEQKLAERMGKILTLEDGQVSAFE